MDLKKHIVKYLKDKGFKTNNKGTNTDNSVDYPDFIHPVSKEVEENISSIGIIICGSGNGAAMIANKRKLLELPCVGIRKHRYWRGNTMMLIF